MAFTITKGSNPDMASHITKVIIKSWYGGLHQHHEVIINWNGLHQHHKVMINWNGLHQHHESIIKSYNGLHQQRSLPIDLTHFSRFERGIPFHIKKVPSRYFKSLYGLHTAITQDSSYDDIKRGRKQQLDMHRHPPLLPKYHLSLCELNQDEDAHPWLHGKYGTNNFCYENNKHLFHLATRNIWHDESMGFWKLS
ncbi:hypothetical protein EV356DRAFT_529016 [Viridothelium virens]|uniref:Uncharacterized protein n=1 Tax=Viridothelium virens TaxID=1048519 RepID=A0A6A6HMA1_VIRVR|nr:hypothetical protein EV356DRAFT_529016 [Viridothelium virens]